MGRVLSFVPPPRSGRPRGPDGQPAAVIIFPGIRQERREDAGRDPGAPAADPDLKPAPTSPRH